MKTCLDCGLEKSVSDFYKQPGRKRGQSYCKECFNTRCAARWRAIKQEAILALGNACHDCKGVFPAEVYDFHHVDPSKKTMMWNKMRMVTPERRNKELALCVLLCANCHRIRHS